MPQLGETVTEGTITAWLKQVGDPIAIDDALFEVSTEKVDTEVPSAFGGFLRAVLVDEGDTVPVGTLVAVITATADEPFDVGPAAAPAAAGGSTLARHRDSDSDTPAPVAAAASWRRGHDPVVARPTRPVAAGSATAVLSPVVRALLDEHGLTPEQVSGSGRQGR
ncbi:MAG: dihydrolipoamide acyltransferase, partial [Acidimicrobiales bacterium]|nr:dihydrolipoamide acyltransferase [Acidimicrobiales bacterium]